jgi:hypothetical protein
MPSLYGSAPSATERTALIAFPRALVLLSLCATLAVATRADTTVDDAGRFAANFPGPIKRSSQPVDTTAGKIDMNMVYTDAGAVDYMVIYCDYPAGSVARSGGRSAVLNNAAKGAVENVKGTIRTKNDFRLGDVLGLEIIADMPDSKLVARARFFVVGDRLFQVLYVGLPDTEIGKDCLDFIDSFRLLR